MRRSPIYQTPIDTEGPFKVGLIRTLADAGDAARGVRDPTGYLARNPNALRVGPYPLRRHFLTKSGSSPVAWQMPSKSKGSVSEESNHAATSLKSRRPRPVGTFA